MNFLLSCFHATKSSSVTAESIQNVSLTHFMYFSLLKAVSLPTLIHKAESERQVSYSVVKLLQKNEITEWHGLMYNVEL